MVDQLTVSLWAPILIRRWQVSSLWNGSALHRFLQGQGSNVFDDISLHSCWLWKLSCKFLNRLHYFWSSRSKDSIHLKQCVTLYLFALPFTLVNDLG